MRLEGLPLIPDVPKTRPQRKSAAVKEPNKTKAAAEPNPALTKLEERVARLESQQNRQGDIEGIKNSIQKITLELNALKQASSVVSEHSDVSLTPLTQELNVLRGGLETLKRDVYSKLDELQAGLEQLRLLINDIEDKARRAGVRAAEERMGEASRELNTLKTQVRLNRENSDAEIATVKKALNALEESFREELKKIIGWIGYFSSRL